MSTIEPIVPGGVGGFGGSAFSVVSSSSAGAAAASAAESPWLGLAQIILDSGSEFAAIRPVRFPGRIYEGRILDWGSIERSVATPSGMPQTSDLRVRLADTDRKWRDLFKTQTPLHRPIRIKFVRVDETESFYAPFITASISNFTFGPGYVEIEARDESWDWLDEEIDPIINRTNYPDLAGETNEAFFPICFGHVDDVPGNQGVFLLPHIGWDTIVDRYALARHQIWDVSVFRKTPADATFIHVDPAEFNVVVTPTVIGSKTYDLTYIEFLVQQVDGTLISAECDGAFFRPEWYGYPASGYDPILNPGGTLTPFPYHQNPIECFIILMLLEFEKAGSFDAAGIMAIRDKFHTILIDLDPMAPIPWYGCNGVITEKMTRRALLGQFLVNWNLDIFHNRRGEIALNFTDASDPSRPLFSDRRADGDRCMILRESFTETRNRPTVNQYTYSWRRIHSLNRWGEVEVLQNADDIAASALPEYDADYNFVMSGSSVVRNNRIENATLEMWFLREPYTAVDVIGRRLAMQALGSYIQTFDVPLPEIVNELDICSLVGITHANGLATGGYRNVEAKIIGISLNLRTYRATLTTILRTPQTIVLTGG